MSNLRHIYRNNKLVHIPSKRYNRKYNPEYLAEKASKGVSAKLGIADFDGDGDIDGTYPKQRAGVAEKPGIFTAGNGLPPLRGPRFYGKVPVVSPHEGPTDLNAWRLPSTGPLSLTTSIVKPALGPEITRTVISPDAGPNTLSSQIIAPALGPSSASVGVLPVGGPTNLTSLVQKNYMVLVLDAPYNIFLPIAYDPDIILIKQPKLRGTKHIIAVDIDTQPKLYLRSVNWTSNDYRIISNYKGDAQVQMGCWAHMWNEQILNWSDHPYQVWGSNGWGDWWGGINRSGSGYKLNAYNIPANWMVTGSQVQTMMSRANVTDDEYTIMSGIQHTDIKASFEYSSKQVNCWSNTTDSLAPWYRPGGRRSGIGVADVAVPNIAPSTGPSLMSAT